MEGHPDEHHQQDNDDYVDEDDDEDVGEIPSNGDNAEGSQNSPSAQSPSSDAGAAPTQSQDSPPSNSKPTYQDFVDRLHAEIVGFEKMTTMQAQLKRSSMSRQKLNNKSPMSPAAHSNTSLGALDNVETIISEDIFSSKKEDDKPFIVSTDPSSFH